VLDRAEEERKRDAQMRKRYEDDSDDNDDEHGYGGVNMWSNASAATSEKKKKHAAKVKKSKLAAALSEPVKEDPVEAAIRQEAAKRRGMESNSDTDADDDDDDNGGGAAPGRFFGGAAVGGAGAGAGAGAGWEGGAAASDDDQADYFAESDVRPHFPSIIPSGVREPLVLTSPRGCTPSQHSIPTEFAQYLRDYQKVGIQFLYDCFAAGHGALLGDDMGLGKTIQVIGLLVAVLRLDTRKDLKPEFLLKKGEQKTRRYEGTALIIVPPAVLYNWKKELATWGHFRIGCGARLVPWILALSLARLGSSTIWCRIFVAWTCDRIPMLLDFKPACM
jgi:hypothetical protein